MRQVLLPPQEAPGGALNRETAGLSCAVLTDPAEVEALRPAWSALLERCARAEITQTPHWLLSWWQVYGHKQGRRLRIGVFHDCGRLVGLAPLLRRRYWYGGVLPFRRLEFLGSGERPLEGIYSNHLAVLAERGAEERLAASLVKALVEGAFGGWDEVVLRMMSGDTPFPDLLTAASRAARLSAELTVTARAPYIPLPATWDEYLGGLGANSRRNVQRSLRAFEAWSGGTMRLEGVTGPADLEKGKQILVRLHHARWTGTDHAGVFRTPPYLAFHDLLMRSLAERGELELLWLSARDEPVAVLYGMTWNGKVYAYQTGRRTDVPGNVRPGAVLLALAIRRAIERGRREFDLLADEAFYKEQLTRQARPIVQLRIARPSLLETARRAGRALCRKSARNIS
jgi:CelD/BcsL family acetyltransferase involved in cellulose biosynthesis